MNYDNLFFKLIKIIESVFFIKFKFSNQKKYHVTNNTDHIINISQDVGEITIENLLTNKRFNYPSIGQILVGLT